MHMTVKRGRRKKTKALFVVTQRHVCLCLSTAETRVRVKVTTIKNMSTLKAELVAENHTSSLKSVPKKVKNSGFIITLEAAQFVKLNPIAPRSTQHAAGYLVWEPSVRDRGTGAFVASSSVRP